jgi:circadian clock protein KaiC
MDPSRVERAPTGIPGLDDVLAGGLPSGRLYLIRGPPGVGKTTFALQFLLEGVRRGERCLYLTLSETEEEIRQVASSHGWSLEGLHVFELSGAEQTMRLTDDSMLYATADVDLKETIRVLLDEVERVRPSRVVFDSMSEVRLLAQAPVRYRRQLLALKQHFSGRRTTVLLLDDALVEEGDVQVESIAHGVVTLDQQPASYGPDRRRLRVAKLRGVNFRSGSHDMVVRTGGLEIFPRLSAAEHRLDETIGGVFSTGLPSMDALLGGGLDRSTALLIAGQAGTGKSAICSQLACASAARGERVAMFLFEERPATLRARTRALRLPLDHFIEKGLIEMQPIEPAELLPDQFTHEVRQAVEKRGVKLVVVDSLNGYLNAMSGTRDLKLQMHELLSYLGQQGASSVLTLAQSTANVSGPLHSPVDLSYLADTILLLRYFEAGGRVRKAVSVLKRRAGKHESTIREFMMGEEGIVVGEPLASFQGVLTGVPEFLGSEESLDQAQPR